MKASAPGKLVLSGAYAVLFGAPAIVTAVDRRVLADDAKPAEFEAPEVIAGLPFLNEINPAPPLPSFDASALRKDGRKLGLGSSAGICVASLALLLRAERLKSGVPAEADDLRPALFDLCLMAHRTAQGGGSGIDVAAACYGGTLIAQRTGTAAAPSLASEKVSLPPGLFIETWASTTAQSTAAFVKAVRQGHGAGHDDVRAALDGQTSASQEAAQALRAKDTAAFLLALRKQQECLELLGKGAQIPIVTPEIARLHASLGRGSVFLPSGAGGGDVSLYLSDAPSSDAFRMEAEASGLELIPLGLEAEGLRFES